MSVSKTDKNDDFLFGTNAVYIEELYAKYLQDKSSVDKTWQDYFGNIGDNTLNKGYIANKAVQVIGVNLEEQAPKAAPSNNEDSKAFLRLKAENLIDAYRVKGHFNVILDPLGLEKVKSKEELKLTAADFTINSSHKSMDVSLNKEFAGRKNYKIDELEKLVNQIYCGDIALEADHLPEHEKLEVYRDFELISLNTNFDKATKTAFLKKLVEIEGFEQYLHVKFPGAKRFSCEGGESAILAVSEALNLASKQSVDNAVIGMAHRGRLNTLVNVLGKPYRALLAEFQGKHAFPDDLGVSGDVKYHMGYSNDIATREGKMMHLSLTPNPSHLEAVNPVMSGKVRAKQDKVNSENSKASIMPILIHGDAAFCGQGVVAETLMTGSLEPYNIRGTIHFVINNQVGFTANSSDTRPMRYPTDVAKIVAVPILHVCGDNPEGIIKAVIFALNYRKKFAKDVVIDIVCYRKYGHNEGDEPFFTQAVMYNIIKEKDTIAKIYSDKLLQEGTVSPDIYGNLKSDFKKLLEEEFNHSKNYVPEPQYLKGNWEKMIFAKSIQEIPEVKTGVDINLLKTLGKKLSKLPENFEINSKIAKLFAQREIDIEKGETLDWATGELLAYATLLNEGFNVRLTGQDCGRGTFSHRHSVLHDQQTGKKYIPLNNLTEKQALYYVADSNLSEYAVLGFEYGYSAEDPKNLVIWEAQFGDFANGAQIVFDQFISSAETKWLRMSGLVVLLPHGFEGQGPEHSSARLERFLQLAARDNMQIINPTTPASFFHALRRQQHRNFRKPLIVMTPKSLLRHKSAVSSLADMEANTGFMEVIDDRGVKTDEVTKVVLCSGKIYYDLLEERNKNSITNTALIRLEQYYPFAESKILELINKYNKTTRVIWCQEEPKNMGAWAFINPRITSMLEKTSLASLKLEYIGREDEASPAVGYLNVHNDEQDKIVKTVFNL